MQTDEGQIRQVVSKWLSATKAGDIDTVLSLMTDDVVFLVPGRAPMHKKEFAEIAKVQSGDSSPTIDGASDIQEIKILGDWAFMWSRLSLVITPPGNSQSIKREGHTLTLFNKVNGKWLLARDANLLTTISPS